MVPTILAGSLSCCSVAVFILGWANLNHVRTYVRTTLGWKPGPTYVRTFWNLNLNHVRTYFTWLEAWTYVRTYVLESQSELVALTPILYVTVRKVAFLISCEAAEPRKHCRMAAGACTYVRTYVNKEGRDCGRRAFQCRPVAQPATELKVAWLEA